MTTNRQHHSHAPKRTLYPILRMCRSNSSPGQSSSTNAIPVPMRDSTKQSVKNTCTVTKNAAEAVKLEKFATPCNALNIVTKHIIASNENIHVTGHMWLMKCISARIKI